ncbi:MAG: hypothetical protein OXC69_02620 [Candidatus Tectomicrobia bacterium]|nr:hypothetical protein [Candidatus Tectomicrobia bacterium]
MRRVLLATLLLNGASCNQVLAADFEAGVEAYKRGDYATALREFRPLAEQGHVAAQAQMGLMYFWGFGVSQDDVEAYAWFTFPPLKATRLPSTTRKMAPNP